MQTKLEGKLLTRPDVAAWWKRGSGAPLPPVIVIGMPRSGTTAVTRVLREAGVFVGFRRDRNLESIFFKQLNNWILRKCGTSWEYPGPVQALLDNPDARRLVVSELDRALTGPIATRYLGPLGWRRYPASQWLPFRWGWKDPRNTITLPLWLELFPQARVINVERHGLDVVASLRAVTVGDAKKARRRMSRTPAWMLSHHRQLIKLTGGLRSADPLQALHLWAEYVRRGREHCADRGDQAFTVRFEDLLAKPAETVTEMLSFAGLEADPLVAAPSWLNSSRALAFRDSPELVALGLRESQLLADVGY